MDKKNSRIETDKVITVKNKEHYLKQITKEIKKKKKKTYENVRTRKRKEKPRFEEALKGKRKNREKKVEHCSRYNHTSNIEQSLLF